MRQRGRGGSAFCLLIEMCRDNTLYVFLVGTYLSTWKVKGVKGMILIHKDKKYFHFEEKKKCVCVFQGSRWWHIGDQ